MTQNDRTLLIFNTFEGITNKYGDATIEILTNFSESSGQQTYLYWTHEYHYHASPWKIAK